MNKIQIRKKVYGIIGCFLVLMTPYFVMVINQGNDLESSQSLCPFKMLTGFPCPGCGMTKSIVNCYQGNFLKAIEYHLFGPMVIIFSVFMIFLLVIEIHFKENFLKHYFYNIKLGWAAGICLGIYQFVRIIIFVLDHDLNDILIQSAWR